jgi:hypothetical protein
LKKILLFLPFTFFIFAFSAFATGGIAVSQPYYGTTTKSSEFMLASTTGDGSVWVNLSVGGGSGSVIWYNFGTEISSSATPRNGIIAPSGATSFKLSSSTGAEVYAIYGEATTNGGVDVTFDTSGVIPPSSDPATDSSIINLSNRMHGDAYSLSLTLNSILASTNANGQKLSSILDGINEIIGELTTDDNILSPNVPSFNSPSTSGRIERNKPIEKDPFVDTETQFTDPGNSSDVAEPLPVAPDVADCWDGTCKENDGAAETVLPKSVELVKDNPTNVDGELQKDVQLNPDIINSDSELVKDHFDKDGELVKDTFSVEQPLTLTPYSPTENYSNDNSYGQTNFFEQTNIFP